MTVRVRCPQARARFAAARPALLARARGMASGGKVHEVPEASITAYPDKTVRTEPLIEMGVRYEVGSASPQESVLSIEPIVVDGLKAKTGGGPLGHPVEYIRLSPWCARLPLARVGPRAQAETIPPHPHSPRPPRPACLPQLPRRSLQPTTLPPLPLPPPPPFCPAQRPSAAIAAPCARDPTPVTCKYSGLRFVSKQALEFAANEAGKK